MISIRKFFLTIFSLSLFILISCQSDNVIEESVEKETIESFSIEELDKNNEGYFEPIGYKKMNSITYIKDNKHVIITHVRSIEDYYDLEDNYIRTIIEDSYYKKQKVTSHVTSNNKNQEVIGPLAIHVPEQDDKFSKVNLSSEQQEEVKNHVMTIIENEMK